MNKYIKMMVLLFIGGIIYLCIELLWRGHTHLSMFLVGGICFVAIGGINEIFPLEMGLIQQSCYGACLTTLIEFISGIIINIWLDLGVWDYSHMPFNILGQICLPFFFAWIVLACVAIVLDDYLRYWLFNEAKPHYQLI